MTQEDIKNVNDKKLLDSLSAVRTLYSETLEKLQDVIVYSRYLEGKFKNRNSMDVRQAAQDVKGDLENARKNIKTLMMKVDEFTIT